MQPTPPTADTACHTTEAITHPRGQGSGGSIPNMQNNWFMPDEFQIAEVLGRGGMGVVLRAHQVSLNRDVAIKVMPPAVAGNEFHRKLFLREAQTCAQLRHPGIVQVYQAGVLSDGSLFFVMELVEGQTLDQLVKKTGPFIEKRRRGGRRSISEAFRVLFDLCDALELAHSKGIIHRDIKPQNVLIEADGRARLMDFGIAILRDESDSAMPAAGTPAFMAPEQAGGRPVDHRADIYALGGLTLYLLTGLPPNSGASLSRIARHAKEGTDAVAQDCWDALPPETPASLRRLVRAMLASSADDRPPSIADFRRRLESVYLELTTPKKRSPTKLLRNAMIALALVIVAAGATYWLQTHQSAHSSASSGEATEMDLGRYTREIQLQLDRTDLDPKWQAMYAGWLAEIQAMTAAHRTEDARQVGEYALAQIEMQQIEQLAMALQGSTIEDGALRDQVQEFLADVTEAKHEPEERDLPTLRANGLNLLTRVNSSPR
ncbi:serine/threonine protein kinase [bacterium]|nr:serine/threonine protein kinase [bacterium]